MPDGRDISVGDACRAGTLMFNPAMAGSDSVGVGEMCKTAILAADEESRSQISSVKCAGGGSNLQGLADRVSTELAPVSGSASGGSGGENLAFAGASNICGQISDWQGPGASAKDQEEGTVKLYEAMGSVEKKA